MAILKKDNLSLEINFAGFGFAGWIQYEILYKINDDNIVNPKTLKGSTIYWENRSNDGFKVNDLEKDELIPTLEEVLKTDEPDYWEPLEPDVTLAIYPEMIFPFLPSHQEIIYEKPDFKEKRLEREKLKKEGKKLPDDWFQLICKVDTYNFAETKAYSGNGLALHLCVKRKDIQIFLDDLKKEHLEFQKEFGEDIQEYLDRYG